MATSFLEQHERALAASEYDTYLVRLKSTLRLGILLWLGILALDAFACRMSTKATFVDFLLVRIFGAAFTLAGLVIVDRLRRPPVVLARAIDFAVFLLPGIVLAFLCSWLDGFKSPYLAGLSLVISCRGVLMRERWSTNLLSIVPTVVGFVVALMVVEHVAGTLSTQLHDRVAVGHLVSNLGISLCVAAFSAFAGDSLWKLERAAFEGRSLGRFKLETRIGAGAMGEIWRAFDRVLQTNVALKVIRRDAATTERSHERFEREIEVMAAMAHPNVVRILDYGVTDDEVDYFAMELLEGRDLAALVHESGPLEPLRAVSLVEQAARALAHAHARGIVHRDVKPSNLFVCDDGDGNEHAKLLDFGIAKHDAASRSITMTAAFVGTPHYAAPEMISGVEAGFSSDLYSLGALAFFALTGSPPFDALSRSGVLHAHVNRSAPRVDSVRPAVPSEVADILARALEKDPAARFPSAQAMSQALQRALWRMHRDALDHAPDVEPSRTMPRPPSLDATGSTIEPLRARRGGPA